MNAGGEPTRMAEKTTKRRRRGLTGIPNTGMGSIERNIIALTVNGKKHLITFGDDIEPWEPGAYNDYPGYTLISTLREKLHLMGTKPSCNRGACGACTLILDSIAVLSCMTLTADCHNKSVLTIEGLGTQDHLHPIQEAFIENNASQCSFCSPGMVMVAKALLDKNPDPTVDNIKSGLAYNTCRCGNYLFITRAVQSAAGKLKER
jgi:aerobic carbon-monoxide dehydrogenase small subunit